MIKLPIRLVCLLLTRDGKVLFFIHNKTFCNRLDNDLDSALLLWQEDLCGFDVLMKDSHLEHFVHPISSSLLTWHIFNHNFQKCEPFHILKI